MPSSLTTGSLGFGQLRIDFSVGNSFTSLFIITHSTLGHIAYKKNNKLSTHPVKPGQAPKAIFRLPGTCKEEGWKVSLGLQAQMQLCSPGLATCVAPPPPAPWAGVAFEGLGGRPVCAPRVARTRQGPAQRALAPRFSYNHINHICRAQALLGDLG